MRILSWDLECSGLKADFGIILCCGSKYVGSGKPEVPHIVQYHKKGDILDAERRLLTNVTERLLDADLWLTYFGSFFDLPFINTRLLYHGLPILPPDFPHIDLWKTVKYKLRLHSNRLNAVQDLFQLKVTKNAIKAHEWIRAISGHKKSMDYIVEHCRRDVIVLEDCYMSLRSLITDHPSKSLIDGRGGCGTCGSKRVQSRGYHITRTRKYRRYQCNDCGKWSHDSTPVAKITSCALTTT